MKKKTSLINITKREQMHSLAGKPPPDPVPVCTAYCECSCGWDTVYYVYNYEGNNMAGQNKEVHPG